jgi:hypothetical protein
VRDEDVCAREHAAGSVAGLNGVHEVMRHELAEHENGTPPSPRRLPTVNGALALVGERDHACHLSRDGPDHDRAALPDGLDIDIQSRYDVTESFEAVVDMRAE